MKGNIVLCGFMGSGKTTVGKRLALMLGRRYCDLDKYIERKTGITISRIFAEQGEAAFRRMEAEAVKEVSKRGGMVVACGGGTVLFPENVETFHQGGGTVLLLDVPLEVLQERLKNDSTRPLLQKPNRNQVIAELFEKRIPLYRAAADITVSGAGSPWLVAKEIARMKL